MQRSRIEIEERAGRAKALLNDPIIKEIFDTMLQESLTVIRTALPGDLTSQAACARIKSLDEILSNLNSIVSDEKILAGKGIPRPSNAR